MMNKDAVLTSTTIHGKIKEVFRFGKTSFS